MPRILVADDNANIQKMVTLAFQERGIDVVAVGNGEAAVRKIPVVNPDLVLADVFMPVRNGYEVCEFVKKDPCYSHVPVILLVGAFDPLDEKEARRVGADGVLKKPFIPPDPLIAMVMSALEKNPKIAAELAKAKEAKEVIVAPPQPELEIAAKKEPVPLPEFPEPTAEEAAAIYGFGKGVRAGDDEEESADSRTPKSTAKSKSKDEDDEDEEFGAASASRKWRRAAMDLEIPDDVGNQPAFSAEQDFGPITFPSERDVRPKHIRVEEASGKTDLAPVASSESAPSSEASSVDAAKSESEVVVKETEPFFFSGSNSEPAITSESAAPEPAESESAPSEPVAEVSPFAFANEQVPAGAQASAESSIESQPACRDEIQPESAESHSAPPPHWMDMMAPEPSSEYRSGSWLDAARSPEEAPGASVPVAASTADQGRAEDHVSESERDRALAEAGERPEKPVENFADMKPAVTEDEAEPVTAGSADFEAQSFNERRPVGFSYHVPAPEEHCDNGSESILEPQRGAEPEPAAGAESDFFASEETPANGSGFHAIESHDEHRIEPESEAIPEVSRFFADQAHEESRSHIAPDDGFRPLHAFLPPAPEEVVPEASPAEAKSDFFASFAEETQERIRTTAPENREALAGIPFLNPDTPEKTGSNGADNGKMEAAAQRVLEKLQPQLQDLLSQGLLKPLIESLLQQELEKREK
ncbi:MAG: response regulator [Candidatus Acidiferrales bacterium]